MFLAALDQTIVATAIRTIADDLHGPVRAGLGDHGVPDHLDDRDAALRQARPTSTAASRCSSSRSRSSSSARCCARFATSMYQLAGVPRRPGPRRRRPVLAGAGDHRRHRAAAGARQVPGLLPGRLRHLERARPGHRRLLRRPGRRILGIDRLALGLPRQRADRHRRARRRQPHAAPARTPAATTGSTGWGAVALVVGAGAAAASSPSRAASGAGTPAARIACYVIGVLGLVAFFAGRAADGRRRADPAAAVPQPDVRRRPRSRQRHHRHGHVRRHRRAAALPADRQGRHADRGRPAAAADGRSASWPARSSPARSSPAPAATGSSRSSAPALLVARAVRASTTSAPTPRCGRR